MLIKINEMQWINAKRITELKVDFIVSYGHREWKIKVCTNDCEYNYMSYYDSQRDVIEALEELAKTINAI